MTLGLLALAGWGAAALAGACVVGLRRAESAATERVTRACHELRAPITATRLGLQLSSRTGELTPARLRAIDLELGRAALALDDLLGIGPAPVARTGPDVDVSELLADSVEAWRPSAAERGVRLDLRSCGQPARVRGDRLRLAQATGNLIANAIEHGGGRVEVQARAQDGRIRVEVTDGGPGLPAPVARLVRRAHGARGPRGRGLAIALAIAEDHDGRVAAAPSERGAKLVLDLPAAISPASARPSHPG